MRSFRVLMLGAVVVGLSGIGWVHAQGGGKVMTLTPADYSEIQHIAVRLNQGADFHDSGHVGVSLDARRGVDPPERARVRGPRRVGGIPKNEACRDRRPHGYPALDQQLGCDTNGRWRHRSFLLHVDEREHHAADSCLGRPL